MRKIAILLGLTVSFCLLAGCYSKGSVDVVQPDVAHNDFKGEGRKAK